VSNHDIEAGVVGFACIKQWAHVAESFLPATQASIDTARLQRQIRDLSAKLETTQMRVINELTTRKAVQFEDHGQS